MDNDLPKIIWFLWLQGLDEAPLVVKKCHASWLKHNPDWHLILLDENNIGEYADLSLYTPKDNISKQAFSDILRINLLAKYGGIWVDATCFCVKPLDEWLPAYMATGFFAFEKPGPDRMISSWFIASAKYNYITTTYKNKVNAYWDTVPGLAFIESSVWKFLNRKLQQRGPQIWFSYFVHTMLKVYPYFWFHYLFEHIYLKNKQFKQLWDDTPKLSADDPHRLQTIGLFNPLNNETKTEIDQKKSPVYKLTWKFEPTDYKDGTVLDYLLKVSKG